MMLRRSLTLAALCLLCWSPRMAGAAPLAAGLTQSAEQQMRVPDTAFAPAKVATDYDYTESASDADQNWFRGNHQQSYKQLGMAGGYYERADSLKNLAIAVIYHYQGTAYATTAAATHALNDGVQKSHGYDSAPKSCTLPAQYTCKRFLYPSTNDYTGKKQDKEMFDIFQVRNCLAEVSATAPEKKMARRMAKVIRTVNSVDAAAVTSLQKVCTGHL